jgi:hypothetical protein
MILTHFVLFFLLTPGILWIYEKKTNKYFIALVHAFVFVIFFNLTEYFTNYMNKYFNYREGMEQESNTLKFVLATDLYNDTEVVDKIKAMDGEPKIVGSSKKESYLLFTSEKNVTSKLENIIKIDFFDMVRINKFIKFHMKYPEM